MFANKTSKIVEVSVRHKNVCFCRASGGPRRTPAKITPLQLKDNWFLRRTSNVFPAQPKRRRKKLYTYPQETGASKPSRNYPEAPQKPNHIQKGLTFHHKKLLKLFRKNQMIFSDLSSSRCLGEMQQGSNVHSNSEVNQL